MLSPHTRLAPISILAFLLAFAEARRGDGTNGLQGFRLPRKS